MLVLCVRIEEQCVGNDNCNTINVVISERACIRFPSKGQPISSLQLPQPRGHPGCHVGSEGVSRKCQAPALIWRSLAGSELAGSYVGGCRETFKCSRHWLHILSF